MSELVLEGLGMPECPRWHEGRLWLCDMMTKQVLTVEGDGSVSVFAEVPNWPMGIGFLPDGSMLVVSMADCKLLRYEGTTCTEYADLSGVTNGWVNDLVVDGLGRAYASNTGGWRDPETTVVTVGDGDREANISMYIDGQAPRVAASKLNLTNGLVVTDDLRTLIVSETLGHRLSAFTIADDGSLTDHRIFADLGDEVPNGLALEAEGAVWVSSHEGKFLRVKEGGEILETVTVPGGDRRAVACALGGDDGRQLFMTSVDQIPVKKDVDENVKRTGRVDVVTVDVPGAGWP